MNLHTNTTCTDAPATPGTTAGAAPGATAGATAGAAMPTTVAATAAAAAQTTRAGGTTPYNFDQIEEGVRLILQGMGEDITRPGLRDTPNRVARALHECTAGGDVRVDDLFEKRFDSSYQDIVCVRDIEFTSVCEHHLLPFWGVAHVAYVPAQHGYVCGLSKLARLVDAYARRLQMQERLCEQVADALMRGIDAQGVYVYMDAVHACMSLRGVRMRKAHTTTQVARGILLQAEKKQEVQRLLLG